MSNLILESLDPKRLSVFNKLIAFKDIGTLGGGTALSLQIGHRISYDFDIFTGERLDKNLWKKIKQTFGDDIVKILDTEDQLDLIAHEGVKITFFYDDYKSIFENISHTNIDLFDIRDIAANKAFTLGRRPKWRDYVDLYFILNGGYLDFDKLTEISKRKFGSNFSERLFLEQLVYWDDINDYEIEFLKEQVLPEKIKFFLVTEVKKLHLK